MISDIDETQAPLLDHLLELRTRLLRCVYALIVAFAVCFYFADDIFAILARPLVVAFPPGQGKLIYTKLYEAFFVELKVSMFAAFFISFPVIANQLWAFVAPGLYAREKKAFLPFLFATPILFTMGASLAYFIVMPTAFKWFLGFEGNKGGLQLEALPGTGDYLSLVMQFILAFGISFLLPVLLMLLNRAGIVSREQLVKARRYAIVVIFAVATVATPPDVVSQLMLAIPLLILFEGTLLIMRFTERADAKRRAEEAAEEAAAEAQARLLPAGEQPPLLP
ncbi:Sec-independent protein translocase TatC [Novosphingobium aromaticivorans DSM 12444]|uniref:Sec-independent protein translocase protein TatC n=1 Tax=Novosphingobium aromaticivorans (strain ATCC 700278 / DSM 12444 / CCUG 56034 / CIP 105152 / NBRC 16084 / F199) TaxID=279238 RepID=Q2G9D2_NOVAD|nr:twin-arginine translocase subunit TatC [Novosphingobium aromaticivorans]ABD25541.1 Sec-independent protein translocase TatC [Novosphingobium aromaticivorans DSM 12444]SCX96744.1 Sec-independent protein translocase TatC [Novosphingobium aromaticivorans]